MSLLRRMKYKKRNAIHCGYLNRQSLLLLFGADYFDGYVMNMRSARISDGLFFHLQSENLALIMMRQNGP